VKDPTHNHSTKLPLNSQNCKIIFVVLSH
jgi:hypothetical protein